jgi:cell division protein FtsB
MEVFAEDTKKKYILVSEAEGFKPAGADENQLAKLFKYKGTVSKYEDLPTENQVIGDVYNVEEAYTEISAVGGTSKTYAAGTNWVWNGTTWDPLAGSVDLSNYVTNETLTSNVNSLSSQISDLNSGLNSANAEIAKKVDAVEGSSLISAEKLALIDTNANDIAGLKTADETIDARLKVVEGMIGDGGEVDLSSLTSLVTEQGGKITALETDNTTNKTNIQNLRTDVNANIAAISAINELNTT